MAQWCVRLPYCNHITSGHQLGISLTDDHIPLKSYNSHLNLPEENNVSYSKTKNYVTGMLKMESVTKGRVVFSNTILGNNA